MRSRSAAIVLASLLASTGAWADLKSGLQFLARGSLGNAYREFREGAEAGDPVAARMAGWMCERGVESAGGLPFAARPEEAVRWYRQAAEAGDQPAMRALAVLLAAGRGVEHDPAEAVAWFAKLGLRASFVAEKYADLPKARQDEIAAWTLATKEAIRVEVGRYPKSALQKNSWGTVVLHYDSLGEVKVERSDALDVLNEHAMASARKALELVPPPPILAERKVTVEITIDYRIVQD